MIVHRDCARNEKTDVKNRKLTQPPKNGIRNKENDNNDNIDEKQDINHFTMANSNLNNHNDNDNSNCDSTESEKTVNNIISNNIYGRNNCMWMQKLNVPKPSLQ